MKPVAIPIVAVLFLGLFLTFFLSPADPMSMIVTFVALVIQSCLALLLGYRMGHNRAISDAENG